MLDALIAVSGELRMYSRILTATVYLFVAGGVAAAQTNESKIAPYPLEPTHEFPGRVRLVLPERIHAVPGIECNVYFDNVVLMLDTAAVAFDAECARGVQQSERWTFTPRKDDVGEYPFVLEVRDADNRLLARASSTLAVAPSGAGDGRIASLLCVGDSLTHASVYPRRIVDLCRRSGNPVLSMVGTHAPKGQECRHEGYGGWTAERFVTHYTGVARTGDAKKRGSPFLYVEGDSGPRLDYARYCREVNGGKAPDFVTIFLGCNDTFSAGDDNIEECIDTMFGYMDQLVEMIHSVDEMTWIGVVTVAPPAATQDAFGADYQCGQTRWQYRRNQHRLLERTCETYGGRESERIGVIPAYMNLDCVHNFPSRTAPWNTHTETEGARLTNGVHPSEAGYRQIGDSIYCWLKSCLAE